MDRADLAEKPRCLAGERVPVRRVPHGPDRRDEALHWLGDCP
jgi:hypothetical protein